MNNENKKLSRIKKRRIERLITMDNNKNLLFNKIKQKKKKNKNFDKIKELEIELLRIMYVDNPTKLKSELKDLNKIHVVDKSLHEIKQEILVDYTGEFEMAGKLSVVIKSEKLILDLEILVIMKLIVTLLIKIMNLKMLFSTNIFVI